MNYINVPVSPGELLDKITILEIKAVQIRDTKKLQNVEAELKLLSGIWKNVATVDSAIQQFRRTLKICNQNLWDIEDKIRVKESNREFDQEFIKLARCVYMQNDKRAATKRKINEQLGSTIIEEKSYADY